MDVIGSWTVRIVPLDVFYNLTEGAPDRLLVRVLDTYKRLKIFHVFRCE